MKNKIFLTSMFAVMLAFPAYATPSVGTNNCPDGSDNCGVIENGDTSANCNATPLTYESNSDNYGTYTLTAQWLPVDYSVTYIPGTGCVGGTTDPDITYGSSYTVKNYSTAGITAAPGYTLPTSVSWTGDWTNGSSSVAGTQTNSNYNPGAINYYIPNNLTLTSPDCTPNQYPVTDDCAGGTVDSSLVDSVDSNGYGIDNVTYMTTSYVFQHQSDLCTYPNQTPGEFTCTHNADGTPWFAAQIWDIPDNVTCTANWNDTPYTITYDCGSLPDNGGTVNGGTFENGTNNVDTPVYNGQNYSIKQNANGCGSTGQLDGYHFTGWECTPNLATGSSTDVYSVNSPASHPENVVQTISLGISGNATCVAQWEANKVNLKYLENEGDTTPYSTDSCQYGADTFVLPANPSKAGYTFTGWLVTDWDE